MSERDASEKEKKKALCTRARGEFFVVTGRLLCCPAKGARSLQAPLASRVLHRLKQNPKYAYLLVACNAAMLGFAYYEYR